MQKKKKREQIKFIYFILVGGKKYEKKIVSAQTN